MKLSAVAAITALSVALTACATEKVLEATGGSRSDGTVALSFDYGMFEKPQINWDQAKATARDRCHVWGYTDAEKFGGAISHCEAADMYGGCVRTMVTINYQCTGHPSS